VAIAALEEGKIDKNYIFTDPGVITIGKYSYSNWYFNQYGQTEGEIGLTRAIARSTDTFFYRIGELTGIDKLDEWATKFGLGTPLGIDIPGEVGGLVPTPAWKMEVKSEPWFLGNTYHFSIGQGDLALTPLGINSLTRTIASGGILCAPRTANSNKPSDCKKLSVHKENLDLVKEGMQEACSSGGTGYTFFDFQPQVACKTGTAEIGTDGEPHAWFTVFGPADYPEIILTILVEKGGEGSKVAGPLAREIFDYWFHP
jgi:penicillin-binding protein 2